MFAFALFVGLDVCIRLDVGALLTGVDYEILRWLRIPSPDVLFVLLVKSMSDTPKIIFCDL